MWNVIPDPRVLQMGFLEVNPGEMMQSIDYKKEPKHMYKSLSKNLEIVDVPYIISLMIVGQGDPNTSQEYSEAIEHCFSVINFEIHGQERRTEH